MPPLAAEPPQPGDPAPLIPADDMLLGFLRSKLAGEALPHATAAASHFHDADIYAADPATLTAGYQPIPAGKGEGGSWFFFTHVKPKSSSDSRKSRMVGGGAGTWHSERAPRAVCDGEGNCVGHSQYFSYKRKTGKNCSERTDWYMVEFSDVQEGDHDRVHGGEPVLVLCKIYKAHSGSRSSSSSSSSSRSARKRKATEERAYQSSDPVKAKRRLFDSSAPAPPAASEEHVSSRPTMETYRLEWQGEAAKFYSEACHGEIGGTLDHLVFCASQCQNDNTSDNLKSCPNPDASQSMTSTADPSLLMSETEMTKSTICGALDDINFGPYTSLLMSETEMSQGTIGGALDDINFWPEPEALQGMMGSSSDYVKFSPEPEVAQYMQNMTPSLLMSEPEMTFQGKISGSSGYLRFCSEPEAPQGMIDKTSDCLKFCPGPEGMQNMTSTAPPSMLTSEPEMTQGKIGGTSDFLRFWPEPEATQKIGSAIDHLKFTPRTEAMQKTSSTPANQMMFEPEVPALQDESETATLGRGIQMANGGTPPAPSHCYGTTDLLDDNYWRGNHNSTMAYCCRGVGFVGAPPTVWSIPRFPSSPSMFGGPALWSC
ncbi:unnamed protein product [Urochloa decumbens]|uniref:NAC domain-containing protein n=1 Tax=Urochloa decumbens TaxID=240449 RepID=A0ABC8WIU8_9POAL